MRIVLCDDDKAFASELENRIRQNCEATGIRVSAIDVYTSSEKLVEEAEQFADDGSAALFLDIDMPALSGFDVAHLFQQKNAKCKVVFVTNKDELVFQSLEYHPFFFLRKAHLDEELEKQLAELDRLLNPHWTTLTFQEGRGIVTVPIEAVSFAESEKNYLALYQDVEREPHIYRIRMKVSDAEKQWKQYGFIRPHKGFLVNYRFIEKVGTDQIILTSGRTVPLGRNYLTDFRNALLEVTENG